MNKRDIGIVFSGGGEAGAYQVGIVQALAEAQIEPGCVAGTSVGALNGAVVASSPDLKVAAERLQTLWLEAMNPDLLEVDPRALNHHSLILLQPVIKQMNLEQLIKNAKISDQGSRQLSDENEPFGLFRYEKVVETLQDFVDLTVLKQETWRELHVGIYPTKSKPGITGIGDILHDLVDYFLSITKSEFAKISEYDEETILKLILASIALPVVFEPVEIGDQRYRDGGMGGLGESQGNVPIEPLVRSGCRLAIVCISGDGVLWDRNKWTEIDVIEIRPTFTLNDHSQPNRSLLDYDRDRTHFLIEAGRRDGRAAIQRIIATLQGKAEHERSMRDMTRAVDNLQSQAQTLDSIMSQLEEKSSD